MKKRTTTIEAAVEVEVEAKAMMSRTVRTPILVSLLYLVLVSSLVSCRVENAVRPGLMIEVDHPVPWWAAINK
jgi:hypothetical protein